MGFVDSPKKSGCRSVVSLLALAPLYLIILVIIVNGPLAPALRSARGAVGGAMARLEGAVAAAMRARTPVPTYITAENVTARPGETFEIKCRLRIGVPGEPESAQELVGSYRLDFSSSGGRTWTSRGSEWSKDGIVTHRGIVTPVSIPGTDVIRIVFDGTDVLGRSAKFVFLTVPR